MHFPLLAGGRRGDQLPEHLHRGAGGHCGDVLIAGNAGVRDDLQVAEASAVVEFEKREGLRVAAGAHPAGDLQILQRLLPPQDMLDERTHGHR